MWVLQINKRNLSTAVWHTYSLVTAMILMVTLSFLHMFILFHYADEDKSKQTSQEAESISSQNVERISDQDAAVQVIPLYTAVLLTFEVNLKKTWRLLGQALFPLLYCPLHVPTLVSAVLHSSEAALARVCVEVAIVINQRNSPV